jgi:hypothetical protein
MGRAVAAYSADGTKIGERPVRSSQKYTITKPTPGRSRILACHIHWDIVSSPEQFATPPNR